MLNPENRTLEPVDETRPEAVFKKITVLVLDHKQSLPAIKEQLDSLENITFQIYITDSVTEFKQFLKEKKPNLVLSELHLNEIEGKDILNYCKMLFPETPFIIYSSHSCNKSAMDFLKMGAADFLLKENSSALPATIYKVLRQSGEKNNIKEARKQRWEYTQRFKGLIEHSQEPVITYTDSGLITYASPAIEKVLGYTVNEFVGTNVVQHIHPADLAKREDKFSKLSRAEDNFSIIEEERILHKNGQYIWVKAIISDGRLIPGIEGYMTNFRDITENIVSKVKLEKTLRDLTDYKIALDESSIVAIANTKGKLTYVNEEVMTLSKYTQKELLGSDYRLFNSKEHPVFFYIKIWNTISEGKIWKGEIKMKAKDDTFFWMNTTIVPFLNKHNKPYQYIVVMRDITLRKLRTQELHNTIDLLTNQNKRLLNFSYIVSHNLRSHTSNMQNIVNYLEDTDDAEERNEMMQHLKDVAAALNNTMFNLNEVVSIQTNTELKVETILLKPFVEKILKALYNQIDATAAVIELNIPDDKAINYSKSYLESILHNLVLNAIKYRHPDRTPHIQVSSKEEGIYTVLEISDNGIGINLEKYRNKLFGMYKTFHNNKDAKGLGLFMSKNQIEAMGGKIEVDSNLETGTTFKIYIK
tara:strand:- start:18311 stop:20236 length:1926 start_codon:yes stop_codon:yes gene_type:complete